ncbi:MAG: UDP-3-O-(3-hydroxymyristoyl)glucosamine N-acyltransferase [Micropepsaceae bacterium]
MADPRFYKNRGPFTLADLCRDAQISLPKNVDGDAIVQDVAGLQQAGSSHISFFSDARAKEDFSTTKAGWCLTALNENRAAPKAAALIPVDAPARAFAAVARLFYPEHELDVFAQQKRVHVSARLGQDVVLAPGVVIGPDAEIGDGTRIGANSFIGRGVAIGRNCAIGSSVSIAFSFIGDDVVVQAGARIGGSGFGFASTAEGHMKIPQLGRVIVQDKVEVGANTTIDRGALADTVIGEGTKIDNLVQIGHNVRIGRNCILVSMVGLAGSVTVKDFAAIGGGACVAPHVTIGQGTRVAAMGGVMRDLEDGESYCGIPARPAREFFREVATLAKLAKTGKSAPHE